MTPPPLRAFIRVSPSSLSAGSSAGRSIWARATDGQADRLEPPEVNTHLFRRRPAAPRSFRLRHNAFAGRAAASVASFELAGSCGRADQPRAEQPVESGVRIRRSARRRRSSRGREAGRNHLAARLPAARLEATLLGTEPARPAPRLPGPVRRRAGGRRRSRARRPGRQAGRRLGGSSGSSGSSRPVNRERRDPVAPDERCRRRCGRCGIPRSAGSPVLGRT